MLTFAMSSPGGSSYQSTKTAQIRLNDFLMADYGDKVCSRLSAPLKCSSASTDVDGL